MANPYVSQEVSIKKFLFEKQYLAFHRLIPDMHLSRSQAELFTYLDHASTDVILALKAWFLDGHKRDVREVRADVEFPATPWEFFKQEYAPKWFLKRWPVKMQKTQYVCEVHHHHICPHVEAPEEYSPHRHYLWMAEMSGQIGPRGQA